MEKTETNMQVRWEGVVREVHNPLHKAFFELDDRRRKREELTDITEGSDRSGVVFTQTQGW